MQGRIRVVMVIAAALAAACGGAGSEVAAPESTTTSSSDVPHQASPSSTPPVPTSAPSTTPEAERETVEPEPVVSTSTTAPPVDPTGQESQPEPEPEPPARRTVDAGETFVIRTGEVVLVADVEVTLVEATSPGEGCHDCPLQAHVRATSDGRTEDLWFSFSGNMAPGAEEDARTEQAFGHTFRAERIDDGELELTVT